VRVSKTGGDSFFYPTVRLYGPDGAKLCEAVGHNDTNEIAGCILPSSGTYTIIVAAYEGEYQGGYKLTVYLASTFPAIGIGQKIDNEKFTGSGEKRWYKAIIGAETVGKAFYVQQLKQTLGATTMRIKFNDLPGKNPDAAVSGSGSLKLGVSGAVEGIYYIEIESSHPGDITYSVIVSTLDTVPEIPLNTAQTIAANPGDFLPFKISLPQAGPLFVTLQKVETAWSASITLKKGEKILGGETTSGDTLFPINNAEAGSYYLEINATGAGNARLRVSTELPTVKIGELFVGTIYRNNGEDWAQIDVPDGVSGLDFTVETVGNISDLDAWRGSFDSSEHWQASQSFNPPIKLRIDNVNPGKYYLRVTDHGAISGGTQVRDFSILATPFEGSLAINNDTVRIVVDGNAATIRNLVFKKGSNVELVSQPHAKLFGFGNDAKHGASLATGWKVELKDVQATYARFVLTHPSGFRKDLRFSWSESKVDLHAGLTAPEPVEMYNALASGGGVEAGRDRYAFVTDGGLQTGTFAYPGTHTAIYPSDHTWGALAENWTALWDNAVDETYGYTFTDGIKTTICNDGAADQHFLIPAGESRVTFHVARPKPATPYETISNLLNVPDFEISSWTGAHFTSPGTEAPYCFYYKNSGTADATGVLLDVSVSPYLQVVQSSIGNGGAYDSATGHITWNIASVKKEEAGVQCFHAVVNGSTPNGTTVTNSASIVSNEVLAPDTGSEGTVVTVPEITGISPTTAGNKGTIMITITGKNLDPYAQVKLTKSGEQDILPMSSPTVTEPPAYPPPSHPTGATLSAGFDLTGKAPGTWSVVVTNPGGAAANLTDALTVEEGGEAKLWVEIVGTSSARVGRKSTFMINIGNSGNVEAVTTLIWIAGIPRSAKWTLGVQILDPPATDGPDLGVNWSSIPISIDGEDGIYIPLILPRIAPGEKVSIPLSIEVPIGQQDFTLQAWVSGSLLSLDIEVPSEVLHACPDKSCTQGMKNCLSTLGKLVGNWLFDHGLVKLVPGGECAEAWVKWVKDKAFLMYDVATIKNAYDGGVAAYSTTALLFDVTLNALTCAKESVAVLKYVSIALEIGAYLLQMPQVVSDCREPMKNLWDKTRTATTKAVQIVASHDPNDKSGPTGYDPENIPSDQKKHWVSPDRPFPYMVNFENLETATAAVQDMKITDQLDENLDWATFSLGTVQLGAQAISVPQNTQTFTTTVDFRPDMSVLVDVVASYDAATGKAEWLFRGKDPYTGDLADFLPPNTDSVDPKGKGFVSYTVKPKSGLATGTVIKNKATIDFEVDVPPAPMDTPLWWNTIDSVKPTSKVTSLPPVTSTASFAVSWSGSDDSGGSGIGTYTVYVSVDGGEYTPWLTNTPLTSSTYTGTHGHTYRFYSRAADNAGNTEPPKTSAEATTLLKISHTLGVSKTGTGSGTVTSSPSGISCGSTCSAPFDEGTVVNLTATPATGSTFTGWSGGGCSGSGACTVTLGVNTSVNAVFTLNKYTLTGTVTGTGSGTIAAQGLSCTGNTCTGIYDYNTTVTVTATPSAKSVFSGWSGCDSASGNTCVIKMTSAKAISAGFTLLKGLTVTKEGKGVVTSSPGGISCGETCSALYMPATVVSLTPAPDPGYAFAYWSGACMGKMPVCTVTMNADTAVQAVFNPIKTKQYRLGITKVKVMKGDGTVVSTDGAINCGKDCRENYYPHAPVALNATPAAGSVFTGWSAPCSGTGSCVVTMEKAYTVRATFAGPPALTVAKVSQKKGKGTITSIPPGINCGSTCKAGYTFGTQVALTATPDPGSIFGGWKAPCSGTGTCTVKLEKNATVRATFVGPGKASDTDDTEDFQDEPTSVEEDGQP
jgi:hypothetical protein